MAIDHVEHVRRDAAALAATVRRGPLDAPVSSCPGWDLSALVTHVGRVHRWATQAVRTGAEPARGSFARAPEEGEDPVSWLEQGAADLVTVLSSTAPDSPCWNFAGAPPVASFWARRQAVETAVHRWDAQSALGDAEAIDAALAADGIDELFAVVVPYRYGPLDGLDIGGSLHVHCTDTEGEWTVRTDDGVVRVAHGHSKGDAAVRGPASALLLLLTHRLPADEPAFEHFGDRAVLDRWLALGPLP